MKCIRPKLDQAHKLIMVNIEIPNLCAMVGGVRKLMRRQSKVPLETMCASGLAAVLSCLHRNIKLFELCGHIYVKPPRKAYNLLGVLSAVSCSFSVLFALRRCYAICR